LPHSFLVGLSPLFGASARFGFLTLAALSLARTLASRSILVFALLAEDASSNTLSE
jgi:hypothetical protein